MTAEPAQSAEQREEFSFQAEVTRLLHIMVHSVYSEKEVFLRELISNASDACDRLRYEAITSPELTAGDEDFRILISADPAKHTLTVTDNGVGMERQDLIDNLGTIARSGTARFAEAMAAADRTQDAAPLIGQFGVGFYSAFMVAGRVDVISRKAGTEETWVWSSDGSGAFTVEEAEEEDAALIGGRGTAVRLTLREGEDEFLKPDRLSRVVETYSNHISFPIELKDGEGGEPKRLNAAGALWTRPKTEISEEDYTEFFHHVGQNFGEPLATIHYKAEGLNEYTALLFIPEHRPLDLFDPERAPALKLYVKRVFITDDAPLLPAWLRFVRGVVDSADMPLTVSREMLQNNPRVSAIRRGLTGRVLSELKKMAEKDADAYARFWEAFGPVLKEGIYEDSGRREDLLKLARFRTTKGENPRSLADYVADMAEKQSAIYYLTADDPEQAAASPQLEGFRARGIEVLLLSDPVDSFWVMAAEKFDGKPFQSVTAGAADLDAIPPAEDKETAAEEAKAEPDDAALGTLIALFKQALGEKVSDVRRSARLKESPVCLVAAEGAPDMRMERILAVQRGGHLMPRVLEINPSHDLIKSLAAKAKDGVNPALEDAALLLFDQARILEGEPVSDPAGFARRMAAVMAKGVS
ncbi:MAG: molecular chaperone HtpG [Alphaproteobacteria bacterium]